jgi:hypothetical protein
MAIASVTRAATQPTALLPTNVDTPNPTSHARASSRVTPQVPISVQPSVAALREPNHEHAEGVADRPAVSERLVTRRQVRLAVGRGCACCVLLVVKEGVGDGDEPASDLGSRAESVN